MPTVLIVLNRKVFGYPLKGTFILTSEENQKEQAGGSVGTQNFDWDVSDIPVGSFYPSLQPPDTLLGRVLGSVMDGGNLRVKTPMPGLGSKERNMYL